ncbi:glycosyltransferase family 4 protein [Opitutales bacterium]|nr:glycosyltransferase family 4 protein [Opitutales bacterium]
MNILFDGVFNCNPKSGVHRYFYNLIKHLPDKFHKYSSTTESKSYITNHYTPYFKHFRPHKLSFALEYFWFRKQALAVNFDLVHSAFYNLSKPCRFLLNKSIPHIITVHDLIHELFDKEDIHVRQTRKNILQNAKAIISVSHNTKKDLLNIYPSLEPDKVFVIHHGLTEDKQTLINASECKKNYLLYVGHREGYKNFKILMPTLKEIRKKYPIELFVVGPQPTNSEIQLIKKHNLNESIKFKGIESDEMLSKLYEDCIAFLYPSLYEGFGYPLIESMARGAIPIASKTSCIPEVLGKAGIKVKPSCPNSLAKAVYSVIENENYRNSLRLASIQRSKKFPLKRQIQETIRVYKTLCHDRSNENRI